MGSDRQPPVDYIERTAEKYTALGFGTYGWVHSDDPPPFFEGQAPTGPTSEPVSTTSDAAEAEAVERTESTEQVVCAWCAGADHGGHVEHAVVENDRRIARQAFVTPWRRGGLRTEHRSPRSRTARNGARDGFVPATTDVSARSRGSPP